MIYDEYESYLKEHKARFGDRTIVLYECGSFFEIYDDGSGATDMKEIGDLLNIIVSRRNKAIIEVSRANFEMAGFPSHALKKFIGILLSSNYTVVLVRQVTPPPNPKRQVTEILSPGTCLDVVGTDHNNLMVVSIDAMERYNQPGYDICLGCACVDITTGSCFVYETTTYQRDESFVFDEFQRLMITHAPRELELIRALKIPLSPPQNPKGFEKGRDMISFNNIQSSVNFGCTYIHNSLDTHQAEYSSIKHQEFVISRVYPQRGMLTPLEYVGLERMPYAAACFTRLLEFAHMHNESLITRMEKPRLLGEQDTLLLSNTSIQQLDIIKGSSQACLLSILNACKTAIGKRYFKQRLLSPRVKPSGITRDLDIMDAMNIEDVTAIRKHLEKVYDLQRLFRRASLCKLHPHEFVNLYQSLATLHDIKQQYPIIDMTRCKDEDALPDTLETLLQYCDEHFVIDIMAKYNDDSIQEIEMFKEPSKSLVECATTMAFHRDALMDFVNQVGAGGIIKIDITDKDGIVLSTTPKRYQDACKGDAVLLIADAEDPTNIKEKKIKWKDLTTKTLTSTVRLSHPIIEQHNLQFMNAQRTIMKEAEVHYKQIIQDIVQIYGDLFPGIVDAVATIDWLTTCKYNANVFRLTRPVFVNESGDGEAAEHSYLDIKGLRHLLIEKFQTGVPYITNDVSLCGQGMLLYGINSSGKSSLMKAVGLAVIMAQAGMYVPCESMRIRPFTQIFTRILTCDDIQRGHSTFTKEILELRNILTRSNEQSLVIGDELCAGTESASALAIVAAGIMTLTKKNAAFVFATHLHDLVTVPEVQESAKEGKVGVYHLAVHCDPVTNKLVYERKLQPGSGSSLYGIEVCKSLDMDPEFLLMANKIRQRYLGVADELAMGKPSRYNSKVIVKKCDICGKKADEVHHIQPQQAADKDGYIGHIHKNTKSNLTCLCTRCHDEVHSGKIDIKGYQATSEGTELVVCTQNAPQKDIKDSKDAEMIQDILHVFNSDAFNSTLKTKKAKYEYLMKKWGVSKYIIDQIKKTIAINNFFVL